MKGRVGALDGQQNGWLAGQSALLLQIRSSPSQLLPIEHSVPPIPSVQHELPAPPPQSSGPSHVTGSRPAPNVQLEAGRQASAGMVKSLQQIVEGEHVTPPQFTPSSPGGAASEPEPEPGKLMHLPTTQLWPGGQAWNVSQANSTPS